MKKYTLFFLLVFLIQSFSNAQEKLTDAIVKINNAYASSDKMLMEIDYTLLKGIDTFSVVQKESGNIRKKGTSLYSKVGEVEIIKTPGFSISINNKEKTIAFQHGNSFFADPANKGIPDVNKLIEMADTAYVFDIAKDQRGIVLSSKMSDFSKVVLTYDTKKYFIQQMDLYYRSANVSVSAKEIPQLKLQVQYKKIQTKGKIQPSIFDETTYVVRDNDKFVCAKTYKEYKLFAGQ